MPRVVDHRERRRLVAEATAELIAEAGVEAVTIRAIAEKLNFSTAIVQHYFSNKRQLLLFTLRLEGSFGQRRVATTVAHDPADLLGLLAAMLPIDEARNRSWRTWLAYWGSARFDQDVTIEHRRMFEAQRSAISHGLRVQADNPALKPGIDNDIVARQLLAVVHGIGMEAVCHPADWSPESQLAVVAGTIRDATGLDMSRYAQDELQRVRRAGAGRAA